MKTQAVLRGGDIELGKWLNQQAKQIVDADLGSYEGLELAGYEDRHEWVRDALKYPKWEDLAGLPVVRENNGLLLWAKIGQEECRSSGYPIRYVILALAVPKSLTYSGRGGNDEKDDY